MNRADLIERTCLHGDWTIITDDAGLPILVVCGRCGADREVKVKFTYSDICRQMEADERRGKK